MLNSSPIDGFDRRLFPFVNTKSEKLTSARARRKIDAVPVSVAIEVELIPSILTNSTFHAAMATFAAHEKGLFDSSKALVHRIDESGISSDDAAWIS